MSASSFRLFEPAYPYCIVQLLPAVQHRASGLIVDDKNKPLLEGVVLKTWKPWYKMLNTRDGDHGVHTNMLMVSEYQPGDHVLFPHNLRLASAPDEPEIVFVPETSGKAGFLDGAIIGKISHTDDTSTHGCLMQAINASADVRSYDFIRYLEDRFVIVPKQSTTVSGLHESGE